MDSKSDHSLESRPPEVDNLITLCKNLNQARVKYIVVGGMAMIQHGFIRATEDIDLLVDTSPENEKRLLNALLNPTGQGQNRSALFEGKIGKT